MRGIINKVDFDQTEVHAILTEVIEHKNKKEIVKLLTPLICENSRACNYLLKVFLNQKLPDVLPVGTLCKMSVNSLGYGSNIAKISASPLVDNDNNIVVKIVEFKGYHTYGHYQVSYSNIDDNDILHTGALTHVDTDVLTPIEEF